MSSNYDTYAPMKIKQVKLDAASGIVWHDPDDDTKTLTLKATSLGVGNADISLPTSAGTLLNSSSDLPSANLTGIENLGQPGISDADILIYADSGSGNAPAGVTASDLKTYVGGSLPSGTDGQIIVYDVSNDPQSVTMGGDATIDNSGQLSLSNSSVDTAELAAGAVTNIKVDASAAIEFSKLESLTDGNLLIGSASNVATSTAISGDISISNSGVVSISSGVVVDADINNSAAIQGSKIDPDFGSQDVVVDSSQGYYIGASDQDGSWRMTVIGGDLVFSVRQTGVWNQKGIFQAN